MNVMKKGIALAMAALLLVGTSGCTEKERSTVCAVVVDNTLSCARGRDEFIQQLRTILAGGFFGKDDEVAFFVASEGSRSVWAGSAQSSAEIEKVLKALQNSNNTEAGSDPDTALRMAELFLGRHRSSRRLLVCWSDLIPDPAVQKGHKRGFRGPLREQHWGRIAPVELELWGLPLDQHGHVANSWGRLGKGVKVCCHQPGEQLTAGHLGLRIDLF